MGCAVSDCEVTDLNPGQVTKSQNSCCLMGAQWPAQLKPEVLPVTLTCPHLAYQNLLSRAGLSLAP